MIFVFFFVAQFCYHIHNVFPLCQFKDAKTYINTQVLLLLNAHAEYFPVSSVDFCSRFAFYYFSDKNKSHQCCRKCVYTYVNSVNVCLHTIHTQLTLTYSFMMIFVSVSSLYSDFELNYELVRFIVSYSHYMRCYL